MKFVFNPFSTKFDAVIDQDLSGYFTLDQTIPQTITGGVVVTDNVNIGAIPSVRRNLFVADSSAVSPYSVWIDNNYGTSTDMVASTLVLGGRAGTRGWARIKGSQQGAGSYALGRLDLYTYSDNLPHSDADLTILGNGYVGIGKDPTTNLDVDGSIAASGDVSSATVTASTGIDIPSTGINALKVGQVASGQGSFSAFSKQVIIDGGVNTSANGGNVVKLFIIGSSNDVGDNVYPIAIIDENGQDMFWLNGGNTGGVGTGYFGGTIDFASGLRVPVDNGKITMGTGLDTEFSFDGSNQIYKTAGYHYFYTNGVNYPITMGSNSGTNKITSQITMSIMSATTPAGSDTGLVLLAGSDTIDFYTGGSIKLKLGALSGNTAFYPNAVGLSLGGSSKQFYNLFIDGIAYIDEIRQEDNEKHYFGTANDVSVTYNGTNTIFTNEVGSGEFQFGGVVKATGYKSSDGSAGVSGSFTTTDGKTITIKDGLVTSIV